MTNGSRKHALCDCVTILPCISYSGCDARWITTESAIQLSQLTAAVSADLHDMQCLFFAPCWHVVSEICGISHSISPTFGTFCKQPYLCPITHCPRSVRIWKNAARHLRRDLLVPSAEQLLPCCCLLRSQILSCEINSVKASGIHRKGPYSVKCIY